MSEEIRIYVADLAAYNNGVLHGVWIDATQELDNIQEQIKQMLEASPIDDAEEYAIHDYEGFGSYSVSEYEGIQSLHEVACFIEEHGEISGVYFHILVTVSKMHKKPLKKIILVVIHHWLTMPKS